MLMGAARAWTASITSVLKSGIEPYNDEIQLERGGQARPVGVCARWSARIT